MKKFEFRLEKLLQLRQFKEKNKQKEHGAVLQKVINQKKYLEALDIDRKEKQIQLRSSLSGSLSVSQLSGFSRYFIKLKKDELTGYEMLGVHKKEAELKRLKLVEATKQRKIYEKLKEHQFEAFKKEYELLTLKEQDELASKSRHNKKSSRAKSEASFE